MSIKNRYIFVESPFESELVQTLLFEAGAGWMHSGKSSVPVSDSHIVINARLGMSSGNIIPDGCKELSLLELVDIVQKDDSVENNTLHICEVVDNHIGFQDSEVNLNPDELFVLLRVIRSLPNRDFEITTRDEDEADEEFFTLTNLTINFK